MKTILALFLLSLSAFADCFDDECLSPQKVFFEGPFNSDGAIKISCADSSHFSHVFVAMSYEWKMANNEILKGRIINWISDVDCNNYKKIWAEGPSLFFRYEYSGDRYENYESPKTCVDRFDWDAGSKKFIDKKSKCELAEWEIKDKKARKILNTVEKNIGKGDFKALSKISKKDVQFLKNRFTNSIESFRNSYETAMRNAGIRYLERLKKKSKNVSKVFRSHLDYTVMVESNKAWFDRICPEAEVVACKINSEEGNESDEALNQEFQKRLMKSKFAVDWVNELAKQKDGSSLILGLSVLEYIDQLHELLDGVNADKQVSARLKLADLAQKTVGYDAEKIKFYEKYFLAVGEARRCNEIPERAWTELARYYGTEYDESRYTQNESDFKVNLAGQEKEAASNNLVSMISIRANQKRCELIPKDYFKKLRSIP